MIVPFQKTTAGFLDFQDHLFGQFCLCCFDQDYVWTRDRFQKAPKADIARVARHGSTRSKDYDLRSRAFDDVQHDVQSLFGHLHGIYGPSKFHPLLQINCLYVSCVGQRDQFNGNAVSFQRIPDFNIFTYYNCGLSFFHHAIDTRYNDCQEH